MIAWVSSIVCLAAIWLWAARRFGPQTAVGCVLLLSCLVPTWCRIEVGDLPLDARLVSVIFSLVAYCFHPKATFPWRLGWIDACMLMLLAVHALSDTLNTGWKWTIPLRIYGEWCVAYFAGRLAMHQDVSLRRMVVVGAIVGAVLYIGGIVEAIFEVHPWEAVYGERFFDGISRTSRRWGMLRAWGPCGHPIYFSVLQLLFVPWTAVACRDLLRKRIHAAWLLPLLMTAGILSTGTRGGVVGLVVCALGAALVLIPRARLPIAASATLLFVVGCIYHERVFDALHTWGGEQYERGKVPSVVVDEKDVQVTSVFSRIYIWQVYRRAVVRAGWLGFGTESVTGFPISVPVGPEDTTALREIRFIDNEYLLLALRFGWIGSALFATAIGLSTIAWAMRSVTSSQQLRFHAAFGCGTMAAAAAILLTVWMPHDIGFPLLAWMGAGAAPFMKSKIRSQSIPNEIRPGLA